MSDPLIDAQIEIYRRSFLEHGDSPRATFNARRELQWLRFERLVEPLRALLPGQRFSVHDVGAGLCDLHAYLVERGIEHDYSATEIVPDMIELARRKYPGIDVESRDLLADPPAARWDFVVTSGMFNLPGDVPVDAWRRFCEGMLERMFAMTTHAIAVNFLTSHRTFSDPTLFYLDPGELIAFSQQRLSRFVSVDHSYPLYEYTAVIVRPERVSSAHPGEAFDKYLRQERR